VKEKSKTRLVFLRTGIVLGRDGGVVANMLFPFEFGLGGPFGNGKQWMSWIHIDDLQRLIAFAINNDKVEGPLNGTSPNPVTNTEFANTLGSVLRYLHNSCSNFFFDKTK
jgi:NAD dependent epimerase/dehydratase family enzyme